MKESSEFNQLYALIAYSQKTFRMEDTTVIRRIEAEVDYTIEEGPECGILYGISAFHTD